MACIDLTSAHVWIEVLELVAIAGLIWALARVYHR